MKFLTTQLQSILTLTCLQVESLNEWTLGRSSSMFYYLCIC